MKKKSTKKPLELNKLKIVPLDHKGKEKVFGATGAGCPNPVTYKCTIFPAC